MKEFRKDRNCTEHYTSLESLREGFGLKPVNKRTKDENKLNVQREKFLGTCKACKKPLVYNGGNILTCDNEHCKGIKITKKDSEGNDYDVYMPYYRLLDPKGESIANNLFN